VFEVGTDQAAGLRHDAQRQGPSMMLVTSPAQPSRAYELLCHLAIQLKALGRLPVIIDGTAVEATQHRDNDGSHLGLQHALTDASMSGLGHPAEGHEWLVMPAAQGLRSLQQTALAAGAAVALSRLLSPFAPGSLLLVFAPAHELSPLASGLTPRVLVPVLPWPQASIDAYGAVKLLHMAGAVPVLAPMGDEQGGQLLAQIVEGVTDCARRHLDLSLERWGEAVWATGVQECALGRPQRIDIFHGLRDPRFAGLGLPHSSVVPSLWS
jgi:hypothetical protein